MYLSANTIQKIKAEARKKSGSFELLPNKTIKESIINYGSYGYYFYYNDTELKSTHILKIDNILSEKEKELFN